MLATLGNPGIRAKLLGVVAVPLVVLVALAGVVVAQAVGTASAAQRVSRLTGTAATLDAFVHALQTERSRSTRVLDAGGVDGASTAADTRALATARRVTDLRRADADAALAQAPTGEVSPAFAAAAERARRGERQIPGLRSGMDTGGQAGSRVLASYTDVIDAHLAVVALVADATDDTELAQSLRGYTAYTQLVEAAWVERDVVATAWDRQWLRPDEYHRYVGAVWRQDDALDRFRQLAPPAQVGQVTGALGPQVTAPLVDARRHVGELLSGPSPAAARIDWAQDADRRIAALTRAEPALVEALAGAADDLASAARTRAALIGVGTVAGVLLLLALGGVVSRRIVDPIRGLTTAATRTAQLLPEVVERMQTPGAAPPQIERIPVAARDEVGRLAEAFNEVNDVALRVAGEQASLRAGIADMFVNVARRNQVLLGRQLTVIDRMEDDEQDPDRLERLFQVDHLATRMRRNAESLLVLAGVDASRRLRARVRLTDVIRSAISEIESYERVDLMPSPVDAPVQGRLAMSVAHLLAELIENAAHFSNPDSHVVITTRALAEGVEVTIEDRGLGMTDAELVTTNDAFARGSADRVTIGRRLGFLVVGRLSERLGAGVRLGQHAGGGTVATVTLPAALFVPGRLDGVLPAADAVTAGSGHAPVGPVPAAEPAGGTAPVAVPAPRPAEPVAVPQSAPVPAVAVPLAAQEQVFTPISAPARNVLPGRHSAPSRRRWLGRPRGADGGPGSTPAVPTSAIAVSPRAVSAGPGPTPQGPTVPPLVTGDPGPGLGRVRLPGTSPVASPAASVSAPRPLTGTSPGGSAPGVPPTDVLSVEAHPRPGGGPPAPVGVSVPLPARSRALLEPGGEPPPGEVPVPPAGGDGAPGAPAPAPGVPGGTPVRLPDPAGTVRAPGRAREGADYMADRSALASEALSELSQLNAPTYAPTALTHGGPALARRVPREPGDGLEGAAGAVGVGGELSVLPSPRPRDPEAVRARLTDFRAGVVRGRGRGRGATGAGATAPGGPPDGGDWEGSVQGWAEPMTEERG